MAVLLNLLAIFFITFVVTNISLSALFAVVSQQLLKIEVNSRKALLWLIVALPWFVSLILSIFILHSYFSGSSQTQFGLPHWHHMSNFEWYSWHGITLGAVLLYSVYVLVNQVIHMLAHKREIDALTSFSVCKGASVYQIESDQASAFTSGFISKRCFVTTGLINQTSAEEYDVIIKHEKAHLAASDPVKKWFFALLSSFYISPIAQRLKLHMTLAMEQKADNAVIESGISKLFVASTLVKVAKLNAQNSMMKNNEFVVSFGADVLEQRIYFLLDKLDLEPIHKGVTFTLFLLLILISMTSIDGVHHFMETLFSH